MGFDATPTAVVVPCRPDLSVSKPLRSNERTLLLLLLSLLRLHMVDCCGVGIPSVFSV